MGEKYSIIVSDPGDVKDTAISINYVTERLRRCGAGNVVLILDACRGGLGSKSGEGIGDQSAEVAREKGVITFFSCSPNQLSYELDDLQQGAFTKALLEGLGVQGQCATVEKLNHYLSGRVPELIRLHKKSDTLRQIPYIIAAEPVTKYHLILCPKYATLTDIATMKIDALSGEVNKDFDLAEQLWIRVLAASYGQDRDAMKALKRIGAIEQIQPAAIPYQPNYEDIAKTEKSPQPAPHNPTPIESDVPIQILTPIEPDVPLKFDQEINYDNPYAHRLRAEIQKSRDEYRRDRVRLDKGLQPQPFNPTPIEIVIPLKSELRINEYSGDREVQDNLYNLYRDLLITQNQQNQEFRYQYQLISISPNVPLKSERGVDYTKLRDLLAAGQWKEADQETAIKMLEVLGRTSEGGLRHEDIDQFPCEDLRTIDQLWVKYSNGRFGFSVQKRIYQSLGGTKEYDEKNWNAFGDQVGWRVNDLWLNYNDLKFNYKETPEGHLPILGVWYDRGGLFVYRCVMYVRGLISSLTSRLVKCNL